MSSTGEPPPVEQSPAHPAKQFEFQAMVLRRLLDAGMETELAFDAVTRFIAADHSGSSADFQQLAVEYADYLMTTWHAASQVTRSVLQRTPQAHKIPQLAVLMFLRAIERK